MAALSQSDVRAIVAKAPPGTSPEGIIAALREQGHTLAGYGSAAAPVPSPGAHTPDWRANALAMLPAAGATAGGVLGGLAGLPEGGVGAIPGAVIGGGLGAASGRVLENAGRKMMGLAANQGMVERMGAHLPPALSEPVDTAEQALMGGLGEGAGTAAFGIPGRLAGGLERGAAGIAGRQAASAEAGAARKAGEVIAAREAGPEAQAALDAARSARESSSAKLAHEISTVAGKPGAPTYSIGKVADRMIRNNPRAYPDRNQLVDALANLTNEASQEIHGVPDRRMKLDLPDLQHLKQTLDAYTSSMREASAAGRGKPTGLATKAADAMRSLVEDAVPNARAINAETKAAIKSETALKKFAAKQPGGEVGKIVAGQKQREAATLARQALEGPILEPHFSVTHGFNPGVPHLARLAGGTAKLLGNPIVSNAGRYGGDVLHALLGLTTPQP